MEGICDNKSVGVIIQNEQGQTLLIDRAKFPFGLAAPAGHIDSHGNSEQAAITEVFEEVGLTLAATNLKRVIANRYVNNSCRRSGGNYHIWDVYVASNIEGQIVQSNTEILASGWRTRKQLQELARATLRLGEVTERGTQALEPIWLQFFTELGMVAISDIR